MRLILLVPGLCGPHGTATTGPWSQERPRALERLLSRSRLQRAGGDDLDMTLCALFGLERPADGSPPVAPFTRLGDTGLASDGYVLRADPVHLRPDQARLRLFDSHTFTVSRDEASALVTACNALYTGQGWRFDAAHPQRWYLTLPQAPELTTVNPVHVAGGDIDSALPRGADAGAWHAVMNEVQMLLHSHAVNAAREARGEPVINSLWFWGGGILPAVISRPADRICADHPLALGLARHAEIPVQGLPSGAMDLLETVNCSKLLLVLDALEWIVAYGDGAAWAAGLRELERAWFMPLLDAVRRGRVTALEIHPCNRHFHVTSRWRQRHFWKRDQPLASCCSHA